MKTLSKESCKLSVGFCLYLWLQVSQQLSSINTRRLFVQSFLFSFAEWLLFWVADHVGKEILVRNSLYWLPFLNLAFLT